MAGTMSRADLRDDLQASLHDSAAIFSDPEDLDRLLDTAALEHSERATVTLAATLTLTAGVSEYARPDDFLRFKISLWGMSVSANPWDKNYPGKLPDVYDGGTVLALVPAPTAAQIAILGSSYRYFYFASQVVADDGDDTTIPPSQRGLFLLRAQAEACRELAIRNAAKPVTMRDGISGGARNGTPAALYQAFMAEYERRLGR